MTALAIRPMTFDDIPAVLAVDGRCAAPPWTLETFAGELRLPVSHYRLAEIDGSVVAYLGGYIIPDEAHLTTVGVLPELRRHGIAARLVAEFLLTAVADGCRRITLEVREGNAAARALYRRFGFTDVSRRRAYYELPAEDAVVMWIEDTTRESFRNAMPAWRAEGEGRVESS